MLNLESQFKLNINIDLSKIANAVMSKLSKYALIKFVLEIILN